MPVDPQLQQSRRPRSHRRRGMLPAGLALVLAGGVPAWAQQVPAQPTGVPVPPSTRPAAPLPPMPESPLEGLPVARVEVQGNLRTPTEVILTQVRATPGQAYNRAQLDVDVRSVAALEKFVTVRADVIPTEDRRVAVRFVVEERPVINAVEIVGNRVKNDDQIRELLAAHAGGAIDPFVLSTDIKAIEDLYRKSGYYYVRVAVDQKVLDSEGIVRYRVIEGPRVKIKHIRFEGNESFSGFVLNWKVKTESYIWLLRKGAVNDDMLESDLATLRDYYQSKGFLDARISYVLELSTDRRHATVRFIIQEGPQYKIGKILFKGNRVFTTEQLADQLNVGPGDVAQRDKLEIANKRIAETYGHDGYIYSNVDLQPSYTDQPGVVDLTFSITEGKSYQVGRVIVRGNAGVQDRVIRRQVRVYPDQTYDTVLVKKSQDRIKATRLFDEVKITPIGNEPETRDALVEVSEGQSGRYMMGVGVSSNAGVIGQVSLEQQNFDWSRPPESFGEFIRGQSFKGNGQYFRILLEPGTELQRYQVRFEEPYLYDTDYSFANDAYFFTRTRESYQETRYGDIMTFGRRFGDVWSVFTAFRWEGVDIGSIVDNGTPGFNPNEDDAAPEIFAERGGHYLSSIKPGIVRDTTDSRIFPTTGTRTTFAWEQYGAMGGEYTFSKLTLGFNWYTPLYTDPFDRKIVFAHRTEVGYIPPWGDDVFFERFYAGGIGSLRGFRFRGVGPVSGPRNDPIGGDFQVVTTPEVNFPIYEELLRGVVFSDIGTDETDFALRTLRADVGFGLRITVPFFGQLPIALDFAVPLNKADTDRTRFFSFSLGAGF